MSCEEHYKNMLRACAAGRHDIVSAILSSSDRHGCLDRYRDNFGTLETAPGAACEKFVNDEYRRFELLFIASSLSK